MGGRTSLTGQSQTSAFRRPPWVLAEFDEDALGGPGMYERDPVPQHSDSHCGWNDLKSSAPQLGQGPIEIVDRHCDVMESGPTTLQEVGHRTGIFLGFHEFDHPLLEPEEACPDLLGRNL